MLKEFIKVEKGVAIPFHNNVDFCVGTGRMGLALQKEYVEQLKLVQEEIGFKHIRGHGLFTDDMAIYHEYEEDGVTKVEYNYTYLDMVMDSYISVGLTPFLELGFMPYKLASGTQTVFYWKGNTTPPKDYEMWCDMVKDLLCHLMARYGKEEVVTWPIEVWNEPNLPGFWEKADMKEYCKLFKNTFYAIKSVDERFKVGGPAVCGGSDEIWIKGFMEFCHTEAIPVDFVTRHHYTSELPDNKGHYGYIKLMNPFDGFDNLKTTRDIIDSYPEYRGLKIHVTEFNTSYIPNAPIHDTNENAAFLAHQLSRLGDVNESYSYWTFGDIFEEQGVPFTPFHGGFGLVANGCIPKPTFWTFAFYKALKECGGECVYRSDNAVIVKTEDGYKGILWNHESVGNAGGKELEISVELPFEKASEAEAALVYKVVDEDTCNPQKLWHDIGEPKTLTEAQKKLLRMNATPLILSERVSINEKAEVVFKVKNNAVIFFELCENKIVSDRGFDYNRAKKSDK